MLKTTETSRQTARFVADRERELGGDLAKIEKSSLPHEAKRRWRQEMMEEFLKDRAEVELLSIRTDLAITKNLEAIKAEMEWCMEDVKSDRCPEFLRDIFLQHYFECDALCVGFANSTPEPLDKISVA